MSEIRNIRFIINPVSGATPRLAIASAIVAGIIAIPSCIPIIGIFGVVPVVMAGFALAEIRKKGGPGRPPALIGLGLGVIEVVFGLLTLVMTIAGATSFSMRT